MPPIDEPVDWMSGQDARFVTTHWSVVLAASDRASGDASAALEQLCRAYWPPLYAFVRRRGYELHEAQDLTQEFFARLLEKNYLSAADRTRGKFRTFLLTALEHFLANEWRDAHAQKRGGHLAFLSFDDPLAEEQCRQLAAPDDSPERIYERQWALTVLGRVMDRLRARHEERGKAELFAALEPSLGGSRQAVSYAAIGAKFGMSEGNVKVAVHRLRKEFGELLREEIAGTVATEAEVDEEIRQLIRASAGL